MTTRRQEFVEGARGLGVDAAILERLEKGEESGALDFGVNRISGDMLKANDDEHALRVLANCVDLVSRCTYPIGPSERLILFYASLLHDIAKTMNRELACTMATRIAEVHPQYAQAGADHGSQSAIFLLRSKQLGKVEFVGLSDDDEVALLNVIAFHSAGTVSTLFCDPASLEIRTLLLCALFRLADIADGSYVRAQVSLCADESDQSQKTQARGAVIDRQVRQHDVVWMTSGETENAKQAAAFENHNLANVALLLQSESHHGSLGRRQDY